MSNATSNPSGPETASRDELYEALFADLVMQQANMALLFLGRVADPQQGQRTVDLEAASLFIDQLEMLQAKTRGNLTPTEDRVLRQSLHHLQLAFVEVSAEQERQAPTPSAGATPTPPAGAETPEGKAPSPDSSQARDAGESKVKFSKKY